ncbi:hypothetical protein KAX08_00925 [candidate division WOR-3 bacterium]|nr:hypothetical protein [candidate division WOR-3 bacterium]
MRTKIYDRYINEKQENLNFENRTMLIPDIYMEDYRLAINATKSSGLEDPIYDLGRYKVIEKSVYLIPPKDKKLCGLTIENGLFIAFWEVLGNIILIDNTTERKKIIKERIATSLCVFSKDEIIGLKDDEDLVITLNNILGEGIIYLDNDVINFDDSIVFDKNIFGLNDNASIVSRITCYVIREDREDMKELIGYYLTLLPKFLNVCGMEFVSASTWKPK